MSRHHPCFKPSDMDVSERTAELARLLAKGLLRLRRPTDSHATPVLQKVSEKSRNELASGAEQSVTVHAD
ncbi:MAG: hypothetical protein U0791_14910 [Gemmataceae bacterium]